MNANTNRREINVRALILIASGLLIALLAICLPGILINYQPQQLVVVNNYVPQTDSNSHIKETRLITPTVVLSDSAEITSTIDSTAIGAATATNTSCNPIDFTSYRSGYIAGIETWGGIQATSHAGKSLRPVFVDMNDPNFELDKHMDYGIALVASAVKDEDYNRMADGFIKSSQHGGTIVLTFTHSLNNPILTVIDYDHNADGLTTAAIYGSNNYIHTFSLGSNKNIQKLEIDGTVEKIVITTFDSLAIDLQSGCPQPDQTFSIATVNRNTIQPASLPKTSIADGSLACAINSTDALTMPWCSGFEPDNSYDLVENLRSAKLFSVRIAVSTPIFGAYVSYEQTGIGMLLGLCLAIAALACLPLLNNLRRTLTNR